MYLNIITSCLEQMSCDTTTTDCPICMEVVQPNINCVITECGHTFHTRCLLTNIVHNGFGCPYCRTEMVPEELLQEEEDDEDDEVTIIEDDEDEEGREEDRQNWLTAPLSNGVTIRRARMNQLRMYERAHSTMRLMFARLEDNEDAEPEDVEFEDYSTIASDNYSFDEEDDEDYTDSESGSDTESDSGSDSDSESESPAVVDEVAEEAARAMANHLPSVGHITYSLERAEYGVDDFVRILLHNEFSQYSSIIESRRAQSTHRTLTRLIGRLISRYQDRYHPPPGYVVNRIDTSISELVARQTSIEQGIEELDSMLRQTHAPEPQDESEEEAEDEPIVWDETEIRTHVQIGIDLD